MSRRESLPRGLVITLCLVLLGSLSGCIPWSSGRQIDAYYEPLHLRLELDREKVPVGETVHARFTIGNSGSQPVVIDSPNKPVMDLEVGDAPSHAILTSWSGLNPGLARKHLEWKPGEFKTIELTWTATELQAYGNVFIVGLLNEKDTGIQSAGTLVPVFWDRNQ